MNANELRIGNYISYDDKDSFFNEPEQAKKILEIFKDGVNTGYRKMIRYDRIFPISLTEEWLLRFGFEKIDNQKQFGWYKDIQERCICWYMAKEISLEFKLGQNDDYHLSFLDIKCEYVHTLQNLYKSLTNEELTLKSE